MNLTPATLLHESLTSPTPPNGILTPPTLLYGSLTPPTNRTHPWIISIRLDILFNKALQLSVNEFGAHTRHQVREECVVCVVVKSRRSISDLT